ncbi:hypothetical protein AQ490_20515 [Wenjunlia vitaminophila]|uniref:HTH luxR-type domain-containing protein n=2 Tax=Wenjunlia vitaminophila TaxID=76728 RepID=A0A0T6LTY1_WENVI|nr:hypothetical protein AQ490_20515 [Wenjunlia vitaminophila]
MLGSVQTMSVSPVFVGREEELAALDVALRRADRAEPQALLVGGEAGVGKTRLLEEFLARAQEAGAVAAVGACLEIGADGLPFAPLVTALRTLHRELGPELRAAAAGHEGELARLLPDLGEVARESHDEAGRGRLFELTVALLEKLSEHRTIVLAVEDLHWAGRSTRDMLAFLFRSVQRGRLLIVATYRADDLHRRHPLRPFLAELDRLRTVERLELSRFTPEEVARQLAGILAAEPDQDLVSRVYRLSEGNAFFVEELACNLHSGCTNISDSLRDLLLVRVEALPEDTQAVVRVAAGGGSRVEYPLLAAVAGLPEDELLHALRRAVGEHILVPTDEGDGYRFRHALVREAVVDDLLPGERSRLERRYAEALEASPELVPSEERAARLASYWHNARDADKALPAALEAARVARRRSAYSEQLALLERALELWEAVSPETRESLPGAGAPDAVYPPYGSPTAGDAPLCYLDLLAETTVAARRASSWERAHRMVKLALRQLNAADDPLRTAWFWTQRSHTVTALGLGDGKEELLTAQRLVEGLPPSAVRADVLSRVATWDMLHVPTPHSVEIGQEAVRLAVEVGAPEVELHARISLATMQSEQEPPHAQIAELQDLVRRARDLGSTDVLARGYTNLSSSLEGAGRSAEAVEVAVAGVAVADRYRLSRDKGAFILGNLVESLISLGEWEAAEARYKQGIEWVRTLHTKGSLELRMATLSLLRDELAAAEKYTALAVEHLGGYPQPQHKAPLSALQVGLAARGRRFALARSRLLEALKPPGFPAGLERYVWPLLFQGARAEAESLGLPGSERERPDVLARIRATAADLPCHVPVWSAWSLMLEAELARAEGCAEVDLWERAVGALEPVGWPYPVAVARHRLAEALLGAGDRRRGAGELRRAVATADALGASGLSRDVRQLADRARIALTDVPREPEEREPESPDSSLGLTRREAEVLRLVAAGRSNRQIAEELFISPKTVSVHVSNILGKLNVTGRGEAAALVHRLGLFQPA